MFAKKVSLSASSASLRLLDAFSTTWIRIKELGANPDEVRELPLGSYVAINRTTGGMLRGKMF